MILVLLWSTIPSMILGRLKLPVAGMIADKVLPTDAEMQKADWMTGLAAIGGVLGIGYGLWWADAAAGGLISIGIPKDGLTALQASSAELVDGAPRKLEKDEIAGEAKELKAAPEAHFPGAHLRLRETGRLIPGTGGRPTTCSVGRSPVYLTGWQGSCLALCPAELQPEGQSGNVCSRRTSRIRRSGEMGPPQGPA